MKGRLAKKRYKKALTRIAEKIPAAFPGGKRERDEWISHITCLWRQDRRGKHA